MTIEKGQIWNDNNHNPVKVTTVKEKSVVFVYIKSGLYAISCKQGFIKNRRKIINFLEIVND